MPSASANRGKRVLIIDDEPSLTEYLKAVVEAEGYDVRTTLVATRAQEIFTEWRPDAVITDVGLPDLDGVTLLRRLKNLDSRPAIVMLSGDPTVACALEAGRAGAFHFLEKPIDRDTIIDVLQRAANGAEPVRHRLVETHPRQVCDFAGIVGESPLIKSLFETVESVAASDANVLILGENGTGKELIANAIHANSNRAKGPFIKINCAAIPKDLIESELFGHKRGAFTGAAADRIGLLEMAERGTLLLDEIGEMPAYLQTKLLRVLQERECRPIGSDRVVRVNFRLICATNVDIAVALREKQLREDLYFRVNTITLKVPALRERTEDILPLCRAFLTKFGQRYGKDVTDITPAAFRLLMRNQWPGNVRELENAIERAVLVCKAGHIMPEDLPSSIRDDRDTPTYALPPHWTLAEIERTAILQTLERTNWNKRETARILGLYRPTLYSRMRKHEIGNARGETPSPGPPVPVGDETADESPRHPLGEPDITTPHHASP
jgi:DNA-binding NtrC family response regulator